jgi:hypothetical protein
MKSTSDSPLEFLSLQLVRMRVFFFNLMEERKVRSTFYKNPLFKKADLVLKKAYEGKSPYFISKQFLEERKEEEVHTYGETPLTALYQILKECHVTKEDVFLDLGCGRGRTVLFTAAYFGIKSIGADWIESFCELSKKAASSLPITFISEEILSTNLEDATIIYFYSLFMDEHSFSLMIKKLEGLKKGTRVITISYPLLDYSKEFTSHHLENLSFPWGKTSVHINTKS